MALSIWDAGLWTQLFGASNSKLILLIEKLVNVNTLFIHEVPQNDCNYKASSNLFNLLKSAWCLEFVYERLVWLMITISASSVKIHRQEIISSCHGDYWIKHLTLKVILSTIAELVFWLGAYLKNIDCDMVLNGLAWFDKEC